MEQNDYTNPAAEEMDESSTARERQSSLDQDAVDTESPDPDPECVIFEMDGHLPAPPVYLFRTEDSPNESIVDILSYSQCLAASNPLQSQQTTLSERNTSTDETVITIFGYDRVSNAVMCETVNSVNQPVVVFPAPKDDDEIMTGNIVIQECVTFSEQSYLNAHLNQNDDEDVMIDQISGSFVEELLRDVMNMLRNMTPPEVTEDELDTIVDRQFNDLVKSSNSCLIHYNVEMNNGDTCSPDNHDSNDALVADIYLIESEDESNIHSEATVIQTDANFDNLRLVENSQPSFFSCYNNEEDSHPVIDEECEATKMMEEVGHEIAMDAIQAALKDLRDYGSTDLKNDPPDVDLLIGGSRNDDNVSTVCNNKYVTCDSTSSILFESKYISNVVNDGYIAYENSPEKNSPTNSYPAENSPVENSLVVNMSDSLIDRLFPDDYEGLDAVSEPSENKTKQVLPNIVMREDRNDTRSAKINERLKNNFDDSTDKTENLSVASLEYLVDASELVPTSDVDKTKNIDCRGTIEATEMVNPEMQHNSHQDQMCVTLFDGSCVGANTFDREIENRSSFIEIDGLFTALEDDSHIGNTRDGKSCINSGIEGNNYINDIQEEKDVSSSTNCITESPTCVDTTSSFILEDVAEKHYQFEYICSTTNNLVIDTDDFESQEGTKMKVGRKTVENVEITSDQPETNILFTSDNTLKTSTQQFINTALTKKHTLIDTEILCEPQWINTEDTVGWPATDATNEQQLIHTAFTSDLTDTDIIQEAQWINTEVTIGWPLPETSNDATGDQQLIDPDVVTQSSQWNFISKPIDGHFKNTEMYIGQSVTDSDNKNGRSLMHHDFYDEQLVHKDLCRKDGLGNIDIPSEESLIKIANKFVQSLFSNDFNNKHPLQDIEKLGGQPLQNTDRNSEQPLANSYIFSEQPLEDIENINEHQLKNTDNSNKQLLKDTDKLNEQLRKDTDKDNEQLLNKIENTREQQPDQMPLLTDSTGPQPVLHKCNTPMTLANLSRVELARDAAVTDQVQNMVQTNADIYTDHFLGYTCTTRDQPQRDTTDIQDFLQMNANTNRNMPPSYSDSISAYHMQDKASAYDQTLRNDDATCKKMSVSPHNMGESLTVHDEEDVDRSAWEYLLQEKTWWNYQADCEEDDEDNDDVFASKTTKYCPYFDSRDKSDHRPKSDMEQFFSTYIRDLTKQNPLSEGDSSSDTRMRRELDIVGRPSGRQPVAGGMVEKVIFDVGHYDDDDEDDSDQSRSSVCHDKEFTRGVSVRRSTSLKTLPVGTPHRKKVVRFADSLGLDLTSIRTIRTSDDNLPAVNNPKASVSSYAELSAADLLPNSSERRPYFCPGFVQPSSLSDFPTRVRSKMVLLESCAVDDSHSALNGVVRVWNVSYRKHVTIRHTVDSWVTSSDTETTYITSPSLGCLTDRFAFRFTLALPSCYQGGCRVEFAIRYRTGDDLELEYWDNNDGVNYPLECYTNTDDSSLANWMGFL